MPEGHEETIEPTAPVEAEVATEAQNLDTPEAQQVESPESTEEVIKLGDKEYKATQLQDFIEKAQRYEGLRPEFDRKSQELAELKRMQEQVKPEPQYSPEEQQALDIVKKMVGAEVGPLQEKLQAMEQKAVYDKEVSDLRTKYNVNDEELAKVLQVAVDMGLPTKYGNLEKAYFAYSYPNKIEQAKRDGQRQATANLQPKKAAFTMPSTGKTGQSDPLAGLDLAQTANYLKQHDL